MDFLWDFIAGAATGILSGFGVGGGTLLLVYMTAVRGLEQHLAQGINLLYFLPAAAAALPAHQKNGFLEKRAVIPAILTGLIAAAAAAWLSAGMELGLLRKCFGVFLVLIGLSELFHKRED
ncbi:hypothetical protein SDC9_108552 [bioreactor metagenome]|uniref:Uncharacterized protein n=1 Tax=bioreactor metagenome TaxID=1076179 RepID=A0A645B8F4_9ZZZZ